MPLGTVEELSRFSQGDRGLTVHGDDRRSALGAALTELANHGIRFVPEYQDLLTDWMPTLIPDLALPNQIAVRRGFGFVMYVADWHRRQTISQDYEEFGQEVAAPVDWDREAGQLFGDQPS
ncbi:MAG: hypothetical protein ABI221_01255 [Candidatus Saccharimonadales bacterium]